MDPLTLVLVLVEIEIDGICWNNVEGFCCVVHVYIVYIIYNTLIW